jgi:PAS domain S-box-containing protein
MGNAVETKQYPVKKSSRSPALIQPGAKELKQSLKRLEALVDKAPIGICHTDLTGKFTYMNKRFEEVSGYSREEVVGKNGLRLGMFSPQTLQLLRERIQNRLGGRPSKVLELQFRCKDGRWIWVAMEGQLIRERGIPVGFQIIASDITEQKQAEEALRESNARFRDIVENALEWIWEVDAKGKYTYVSPIVEEILGYKPEEIVKKHFYDLFHPDDREKLKEAAFEAFAKKQAFHQFVNRNMHKNGKTVWLSTSGVPLLDEEGNLLGYRGADVDITERKQAEETLLESEERFRSMVENSHDGIIILDDAYRLTYGNDELYRISGYPRQEIIGQDFRKFIDEESKQLVADRYIRRQRGEEVPHRYEFNIVRKDGEKRHVEISSSVIKDSAGKVRTVAQILDITERKRAEEALVDETTRRRILVDQSRDGIVILDQNGKVYEANQRFAEMLGYSPEEAAQLHVWDWDTQWTREQLLEMIRSVDAAGDHSQTYHRRKDGTVYDVEISTNGAVCAGQKLVFCVCRDITARKRAEEELKLRAQILDNATDSIFLNDLDGNIIYVNEAGCRAHGYSREELTNMNIRQLLEPEQSQNFNPADAHYSEMQENDRVSFELSHLRKDGSIMPVEIHGRIIESGGRKLSLSVIRDITERKQAEEALKKAQEQLVRSEKLAAIGQLASGVGHELRNPLAAIKNAVFYVQRKIARSDLSASEPKVLEFLDIVDREVSSANKVISDLLAFSRVAKPTVSPVSIGSIIGDALEHVPVPENIKLTRDIGPSLPMVMVDADQIRQVFVNIILNAVEAMPEGGRLEIRAGSKAQFVEVEFADTGGGVPESIIDKIFDPLLTTKAKGIGLGLAMCKSILERHGGDIRVKSEKGKGAVFTASLPAQIV